MPGPGKQNGKKRKPTAPASGSHAPVSFNIPDGFYADIDNGATWMNMVEFLCEYFELPDLGTRHGLKKVHSDFDKIHKKLDAAYVGAQSRHMEKLMGGIVGIWAKMCADSILRDKLFKEGLLSRIMPILEYNSTRHMGLDALSLVTHHGGESARCEIARKNPVLIKLIKDHPDDPKLLELATVTMMHSTNAVIANTEEPDKELVKTIQVRDVLKTIVKSLHNPIASHYMIDHAFGILAGATLHCPEDCRAVPSVLTLLVAALRCASLPTRCRALGGIIRYTVKESEVDMQNLNPLWMMAVVQRGFPSDLADILAEYGLMRCDTTMMVRSSVDYQKMMMRVGQDHDLLSLGTSLAELIQRTEFSVTEGCFQTKGPSGKLETVDVGLPFQKWLDALTHCAVALRARGAPADLDAADVLELKLLIRRGRAAEAAVLAERVVERNPELAYAYYAISMGEDPAIGLRAAKKGLRCRRATPFVRTYLLWRAVENAGELGVATLQDIRGSTDEKEDYARGIAFLMSAWEDARTFVAEAPPDSRNMLTILNWYIILTIAIKGPELSENLQELAPAKHKLEISERFMKTLGFTIRRTQMRLARELVLSLYPKALAEWGSLIARFDELDKRAEAIPTLPSANQADEDLAAWLNNVRHDGDGEASGNGHNHGRSEEGCARQWTHPKISVNSVALYRCSWCGNPSAVLRKCGGCGKTKYCDAQCQKRHWSEHKHSCKK